MRTSSQSVARWRDVDHTSRSEGAESCGVIDSAVVRDLLVEKPERMLLCDSRYCMRRQCLATPGHFGREHFMAARHRGVLRKTVEASCGQVRAKCLAPSPSLGRRLRKLLQQATASVPDRCDELCSDSAPESAGDDGGRRRSGRQRIVPLLSPSEEYFAIELCPGGSLHYPGRAPNTTACGLFGQLRLRSHESWRCCTRCLLVLTRRVRQGELCRHR